MTVTYDSASQQLWVTGTFINEIIAGNVTHTYTLTVTVNSETSIDFEVELADVDVPNTRYELGFADLNLTEFINGVYSFKFAKVNDTTSSTTFESYCLFLDIDYTCEIIDNVAGMLTDTEEVIYSIGIFNLLKNIHLCEECACSNALALWTELNYRLGLTERTDDCGCN